jgi:hypothetical protein
LSRPSFAFGEVVLNCCFCPKRWSTSRQWFTALWVHLDNPDPIFEANSVANVERRAAGVPAPTYAIDDETALILVGDTVEVISEGHWKLFTATLARN